MSSYFFDSSGLAKRYVPEVGTAWVDSVTTSAANTVLLSEITLAEVAGSLAKKVRTGAINIPERDAALNLFLAHYVSEYTLLPVSRAIIDQAVILTQKYKLRAYDAVQLASALLLNTTLTQARLTPLIFVAADNDLLDAAQAEGLSIANPLSHP